MEVRTDGASGAVLAILAVLTVATSRACTEVSCLVQRRIRAASELVPI